ncbi:MAG: hypothetical protein ACD_54C00128G0001 [uncultured bacterium]|nr:MAG: hypothetical protein ACD_54C00128G0001 [uncultured bacterium]
MTLAKVPPATWLGSKVSVYSPMIASFEALSRIVIVQVFEAPVVGTVGVKVKSSDSEVPRLPKYSTVRSCGSPEAPATLDEAGRFTPKVICEVGLSIYWLALIRTGSSAAMVSRG